MMETFVRTEIERTEKGDYLLISANDLKRDIRLKVKKGIKLLDFIDLNKENIEFVAY